MAPDRAWDEPPEEPGRGEGLDDAWAQIVAGYDREPAEGQAGPWPVQEDLADDDEWTAAPAVPTAPPAPSAELGPPAAPHPPWDDEGHYVPPHPPPLPRPAGIVGAAWLALLGGPAVLLVATVLGWDLPTLATAACVVGFVGGLIYLIARMDDGKRGGPDGWDNGAQV